MAAGNHRYQIELFDAQMTRGTTRFLLVVTVVIAVAVRNGVEDRLRLRSASLERAVLRLRELLSIALTILENALVGY